MRDAGRQSQAVTGAHGQDTDLNLDADQAGSYCIDRSIASADDDIADIFIPDLLLKKGIISFGVRVEDLIGNTAYPMLPGNQSRQGGFYPCP